MVSRFRVSHFGFAVFRVSRLRFGVSGAVRGSIFRVMDVGLGFGFFVDRSFRVGVSMFGVSRLGVSGSGFSRFAVSDYG